MRQPPGRPPSFSSFCKPAPHRPCCLSARSRGHLHTAARASPGVPLPPSLGSLNRRSCTCAQQRSTETKPEHGSSTHPQLLYAGGRAAAPRIRCRCLVTGHDSLFPGPARTFNQKPWLVTRISVARAASRLRWSVGCTRRNESSCLEPSRWRTASWVPVVGGRSG